MKENTTISERLAQLIEYLGTNNNRFALSLGYERSQVIYDIIDKDRKRELKGLEPVRPSFEFFERFLNSEYSAKIDIEWLITGKGEMLKKQEYPDLLEKSMNSEKGATYRSQTDKLIDLLSSQQRVIEIQSETIDRDSRTIEVLSKKNKSNDIAGAV